MDKPTDLSNQPVLSFGNYQIMRKNDKDREESFHIIEQSMHKWFSQRIIHVLTIIILFSVVKIWSSVFGILNGSASFDINPLMVVVFSGVFLFIFCLFRLDYLFKTVNVKTSTTTLTHANTLHLLYLGLLFLPIFLSLCSVWIIKTSDSVQILNSAYILMGVFGILYFLLVLFVVPKMS